MEAEQADRQTGQQAEKKQKEAGGRTCRIRCRARKAREVASKSATPDICTDPVQHLAIFPETV